MPNKWGGAGYDAQAASRLLSGGGVLFELAHKLAHPLHPRFTLGKVLRKLEARWAIQAIVLRLLLQQPNQPHRIHVILLVKLNGAALFVALQLADPQLLRLLAQSGDIEQE